MEFRYDFDEKIDLTKFKNSASYYISNFLPLEYKFYLQDFILNILIEKCYENTSHKITIKIFNLIKENNQIINASIIIPNNDLRFKNFDEIISLFEDKSIGVHRSVGIQYSTNTNATINIICNIIKICYKINNVKVLI